MLRETEPGSVHFDGVSFSTEPPQPAPIGSEGVGEDRLGAGIDVAAMDIQHSLGPRHIPQARVIGAQIQPLGNQPGSHRGVEKERAAGDPAQKAVNH